VCLAPFSIINRNFEKRKNEHEILKIDNRKLILQFQEKKEERGEKKTKDIKSETFETIQKLLQVRRRVHKSIHEKVICHE